MSSSEPTATAPCGVPVVDGNGRAGDKAEGVMVEVVPSLPPPLPTPPKPLSPEYTSNILSHIFFAWVNPLFSTGNKRPLVEDDIFRIGKQDDVAAVSSRFELSLSERMASGAPNAVRSSLVAQWRVPMAWAGVVKFFNSTAQFFPPVLLNLLLDRIADRSLPVPEHAVWEAYVIAAAMFVIMSLRTLIENNYFHRVMRVGYQIRSALTTAVYRKALRMSPAARQDTPTGKIVNLMQLDATRLETLMMQLHVTWDSVYQIIGYMILLGIFLGPSALAGLGSMLILIPFQMFFMARMSRRRAEIAKATDQRVKVTNEALQGVRTLKQYNWEAAYEAIIGKAREVELGAIWRYNLIGTVNSTLMQTAPILVGVVTLLVYAGTGGDFTAARIFAALSVLNQLRFPLMFLPSVIQQLADARVSLSRLEKFMRQPEVEKFAVMGGPIPVAKPLLPTPTSGDAASAAPAAAAASSAVVDHAAIVVSETGKVDEVAAEDAGIPAALRQPSPEWMALPVHEVGISARGVTLYHEEPTARRQRLAELAKEKELEEQAKARALAKGQAKGGAGGGGKAVPAGLPPAAAGTAPAPPGPSAGAAPPTSPIPPSTADLPPVLAGVNLVVPKGKLVGVVGAVGTGKTSLCAGLLGELYRASGDVFVNGRVAYVAQSAWILNATVKKNITFAAGGGEDAPVDEQLYQAVIDVCQLRHDITTLNAGDATEIGERGINLSGGQKQRVSIARAAYSNADVYLFDDPLSALDAEVGKAVFEECISDFLEDKTRLLVTNQLQYLRACDSVVVLGQRHNGTGYIKYQGSFEDLMAGVPEFGALMAAYGHGQRPEGDGGSDGKASDGAPADAMPTTIGAPSFPSSSTAIGLDGARSEPLSGKGWRDAARSAKGLRVAALSTGGRGTGTHHPQPSAAGFTPTPTEPGPATAEPPSAPAKGGLMTTEEKSEGAVPARLYYRYCKSAGYVVVVSFVLFWAYALGQMSQLVSQWWLTFWTSDSSYVTHPSGFYMGIYVAIGVGAAVFAFARVLIMACMGIRASRNLHRDFLRTVLHAPQSFFDTTPLGRILARFSKDFDSIDNLLVNNLGMLGMCIVFVLGSLGAIIFSTPWFALVCLPVLVIYVYIMNYFRNVARETKRFESISRSPIYAHFSETLNGLSTIRAYGMVAPFAHQNEGKVTRNVSAWYTLKACDRWLSIRLEVLGNFIILAAALLAVGTGSNRNVGDSAGLAGFSLSYAIAITSMFNWTVRTFAETEQTMNSVERVFFYRDTITPEPYDPPTGQTPPPPTWPAVGDVEFKGYRMRYRPTTPEVLHGLNVRIDGGSKVGIVGRTGAGKSSIMQSLFRMIQADCHSGQILVDGIDIDTLGLNQLRSKLAIIPQDPVMFSGTIRTNLDPIGMLASRPDKGNAELWSALDKVGLRRVIERMPGGLDASVAEFGDNLSAGQRQLLCLSRVLLRNSRIVLLDEASSSLDHETDVAIQHAIREAFPTSTMLIIAHRLNTIISCDHVLVMDAGLVAEYGHPHVLLSSPTSLFSALVDETGVEAAAMLRQAAAASYAAKFPGEAAPPITTSTTASGDVAGGGASATPTAPTLAAGL